MKYHRTFEIPLETDIETARSAYNNGVLEITLKKKEQTKLLLNSPIVKKKNIERRFYM
jgi:HSP20 family molecular chaperone IbpA